MLERIDALENAPATVITDDDDVPCTAASLGLTRYSRAISGIEGCLPSPIGPPAWSSMMRGCAPLTEQLGPRFLVSNAEAKDHDEELQISCAAGAAVIAGVEPATTRCNHGGAPGAPMPLCSGGG